MKSAFGVSIHGLAIVALLAAAGCQYSAGDSKTQSPGDSPKASAEPPKTAREVLDRMAAAYRNAASYEDTGSVRLLYETDKEKKDLTADFSVVFARPNKLRMSNWLGQVVCDGKKWYATTQNLPGQVVVREAPAKLTTKAIFADQILAESLTHPLAWQAPQPLLLLEDDAVKKLLADAPEPGLGQPADIGEQTCYRVEIKRPDAPLTLWIDQKNFLIRRIVFSTNQLQRDIVSRGQVFRSASLEADFGNVRIGRDIEATAFRYEVPKGAEITRYLLPVDPIQLAGRKVPFFKFVDAKGNPATSESLKGKLIVLAFWATGIEPCRTSLPNMEKVYQKYTNNDKVAVLAVNVDPPDTSDKVVETTLRAMNVTMPIVRDPDQYASKSLKTFGVPMTLLVGPDGVVQGREMGGEADTIGALPAKIDSLLAGKSVYEAPLAEYEAYRKGLEDAAEGRAPEPSAGTITQESLAAKTKIAERSEPKTLKLTSVWKCTELKSPGNLLVVEQPGKPPMILALDGWQTVAEVGLDGKPGAVHRFDFDNREAMCNLRTAVGSDGRRVYAGFANGVQRMHLFDENWKVLTNYPDDGLKNAHAGIIDVALGDLDGKQDLKAYVGYLGTVGVQAASLSGETLWKERSVGTVLRTVIGEPAADGRRELICSTIGGTLAVLNAQHNHKRDITVPGRQIAWFLAADLQGNDKLQCCGIAPRKVGDNFFVGFTLQGQELWTYTLPEGLAPTAIEPVACGRLAADPPAQWILPGPDGSIHILTADGKLMDRFNYGATLTGLAVVQIGGKPTLLVASPNGIEALQVQR